MKGLRPSDIRILKARLNARAQELQHAQQTEYNLPKNVKARKAAFNRCAAEISIQFFASPRRFVEFNGKLDFNATKHYRKMQSRAAMKYGVPNPNCYHNGPMPQEYVGFPAIDETFQVPVAVAKQWKAISAKVDAAMLSGDAQAIAKLIEALANA